MSTITFHGQELLAEVTARMAMVGLGSRLAAARSLARDGFAMEEIDFMLRGCFPRAVLLAVIAEANAAKREPVIR